MSAMEKMLENVLTSLTGMTGAEMKDIVVKSVNLLVQLNERLERIENAVIPKADTDAKVMIIENNDKQEAA